MKHSFPLCVLVLCAFCRLFADSTPKPVLPVTTYGCTVRPADSTNKSFSATAWAEHDKERDWNFLLSTRKSRLDCLKDCDRWMTEMQKVAGK